VLVPVGQDEVLNSPANLHWYGLYVLFWLLLWRPKSTAGLVVALVVVALVAASDILVLAYLPLALFRARRREWHAVTLLGVLTAGLALQFLGLLTGASDRPLSLNPVSAVTGFVLRAVPAPLIGQRWLGTETGPRMLVLAAVAWVLVAAAVAVALARVSRPDWALAAAAAVHAAALYVLPVVLSGFATPRYAVAPALLVLTALVALLQPRAAGQAAGRSAGQAASAPIYALTALLAVVVAVNLRVPNPRAEGPLWSTELTGARDRCSSATGTVEVPISPSPEWSARLPCSYLEPS
jgi:hypothetical protein